MTTEHIPFSTGIRKGADTMVMESMADKTHHENPGDVRAIAKRLTAIRKQRGVTQVELAERLGVSQNAVSEYENAKSRITATMLAKISATLNVSADEILGRKPARKTAEPPAPRRLLRRVREIEKLPAQKRYALIQTIDAYLKSSNA